MKKKLFIIVPVIILFMLTVVKFDALKTFASINSNKSTISNEKYIYPDFYRGIYLTNYSSRNLAKVKYFTRIAKESHINTFVMDVQGGRYRKYPISKEIISYCKKNGIHPVARIVVFHGGLNHYPPSRDIIESRLNIAQRACIAGFKEIQFDYIRFSDEGKYQKRLKHLSYKARYAFVEGFIKKARRRLKKYDVKISADIFGRVPHNRNDLIGQRMESLDKVVDIILPMAYPSHYSKPKHRNNPYYTVKWTSTAANRRTQKAQIVSWIQAFKMRIPHNLTYSKYVEEQIRATHDAGIKGFIMWNARQVYTVPLLASRNYYRNKAIKR